MTIFQKNSCSPIREKRGLTLRYCQMLWMGFFLAQQRNNFRGYLDLFIYPTSKARFSKALTLVLARHTLGGLALYLASAGG